MKKIFMSFIETCKCSPSEDGELCNFTVSGSEVQQVNVSVNGEIVFRSIDVTECDLRKNGTQKVTSTFITSSEDHYFHGTTIFLQVLLRIRQLWNLYENSKIHRK